MLFPTHPLPCRCSAVPVQAEALGRSGQGTTSGRPGCLGVSVHYPSPGVEGSSGAAWAGLKSLACLMLRGPLPGSHSGPPAGGLGSPSGPVGLQCGMRPKDGSTILPQASAAGAAGGARGVCVCQGLGTGFVLCPPRLSGDASLAGPHGRCGSCGLNSEPWDDLCILETWALVSILNCSLNLQGHLLSQCRTIWG